jgi:tetratricopeptide (TPR) repeat protein
VDRKPLERLAAAPFVGRETVLAHLNGALAQALAGHSSWLVLSGEAGIGKTRTVETIAAQARERGFSVHTGRCPEVDGAPPYRPWLQILRSLRGAAAKGRRAARSPLPPALAPLLSGVAEPGAAPGPGPEARFRLFEAVAETLAGAARETPLLLALDDLHRADEASLALLAFCARELADARLLVVATRRDGEAPAAQAALARTFHEIPLAGFDREEVRAFLRALADREPADAFVAALHERTGGIPLFLTELARLLALQGRLDRGGGEAVAAAVLPAGMREVLGQRLARLSRPCRELLGAASVVGREVARDLLERALEPELAAQAGTLLDEACAARVLAGAGPDAFRFSHLLVRELLYDELASDLRARLHGRVARALEALHPLDPTPVVSELAHHFGAATAALGPEPAAHWAVQAGQDAARRLAFDAARGWLTAGLELLARIEPRDSAAARERDRRALAARIELGRACERAGDPAAARAEFRAAAEAAGRLGDGELQARAALGFAGERTGTPTHASDAERLRILEAALAALPPERAALRAPLLGRLALELHWSPERERRDRLAREAVELARASGDPTLLAQSLAGAIWAIWGPENAAWRRDAASEVIALQSQVHDPVPVLGARVARATAQLELGDVAAFDEDVATGARAAAELRYGLYEVFFRALRGMRAILEGRLSEGERLGAENLAQGRRIDSPHTPGVYASHLLLIRVEQGRARELLPAAAAAAERSGAAILRASHAWLLYQVGALAEARRALRGLAGRSFEDLPRDFFWLGAVALLGEVAAGLEERGAARRLYEALLPRADQVVVVGMSAGCLGSASRALGLLATALGRYDAAERHFEAALERNAAIRAFPFLARTRDEYAALLRLRAREGDLERAEKLEDEATALRAELEVVGGESGADPRSAVPPRPEPRDEALIAAEAGAWRLRFGGAEARVPDGRGMRYLAQLLAEPERELHVLDLAACGGAADGREKRVAGLAPVADARARADYRARIEALREELERAEAYRDTGRAEAARAELETLEAELLRAFGLGGRARRLGDPVERARKAVYNRLRSAIAGVEAELPALGRHLARSIRTGTFCAYRPDAEVRWRILLR